MERHPKDAADNGPTGTPSDLEALIGYNLKRAYIIVNNDFRNTMGRDGFGSREFALMSLVVEYPQITQSSLARLLGIERSGLVAIVDRLESQGFLKRVPVPGDRRVQALVPLDSGIAAYEDARTRINQHEDKILANLSIDERASLLTLLKKIRQHEEPSR